jgi:hypothetical protein
MTCESRNYVTTIRGSRHGRIKICIRSRSVGDPDPVGSDPLKMLRTLQKKEFFTSAFSVPELFSGNHEKKTSLRFKTAAFFLSMGDF